MNKSITSNLYHKYIWLLSCIFVVFIITVMWNIHSNFSEHVESSLKKVSEKLEHKIKKSYYLGQKEVTFYDIDSLFNIQVYKAIDNELHALWRINHADFIPHNKNFLKGLNFKLLDIKNDTAYHAIYHNIFEVYRHHYYIYITVDVSHHHNEAKNLFMWLLLLGGSMYLLALYFGYKIIQKEISTIPHMIEGITGIVGYSLKERLVLPETKDELYLLSESINEMLERIEISLGQTKRFNAKVSHELRTPLTIIRGEVEVGLFKDRPIHEYKALLMSVLEEVDTLQSITDNMLLISKLDFDTIEVKKLNVHFDTLIESVISSCYIQAKVKDIKIIATLESIIYPMEETLIRQSIKNLILNAIKYSPKYTVINIVLKKEDTMIVVEVNDQGYGINKEDSKRLYEPYFRSNNVMLTDIKGEGLGLSIVSHAMSIHDAEITVKSVVGKGSSFKILFKY